jgi:transposase InsO family protein
MVSELNAEYGYSISELCAAIDLNRSSYYKWLCREEPEYERSDAELAIQIATLYTESNGILGYRRMQLYLWRKYNLLVNKKRVYRVMSVLGLKSIIRRKRKKYLRTTPQVTAENILNRNFTAKKPGEKWLTDVTEFRCGANSKLYLSAIYDLCDKSIVSYALGNSNNNELVFETFDKAIAKYPDAHPLFHSDRGFQYTTRTFRTKIESAGMTQSMSRVGRCIDNGPMESFWGTLKCEMFYTLKFHSTDELRRAIVDYINYYNNERYQEKLGGLAPLEFRIAFGALA